MNFLITKFNRLREIGLSETIFILKYRIKYAYKMKFGYFVHRKARLENKKFIVIKKYAEIQEYVIIKTYRNPVEIGKFTQINPFTVIYGGNGVYIGDNVMIAPHCMIASGNHDYKQLDKPMRHAGDLSKGPIVIEDGVWIGANSTITDGITIGHNAVVSANSVVTKNVAPFDIVGGVPAKVISNRIDTSLNRKLSYEERLVYVNRYKINI
jgi:acetyltransferase-like isoleucine patch superfamily enzyme